MNHIIPNTLTPTAIDARHTCPNGDCPGYRVTFPATDARTVCPWSGDPLEVSHQAGPTVTAPVALTDLYAHELAEVIEAMDAAVAAYVASVTA